MSRNISFKKPLDGDDAAYVRDRPWLIRDAELQGIKVRFADSPEDEAAEDADESEEQEEIEAEDYSDKSWTVDSLNAEIEARNEERDEDDHIVPDSSKKADLIDALILDDEAQAESEEDNDEDDSEE